MSDQLHLAVALDGYGWHPEAWRHSPGAGPVTSGRYWTDLATTADVVCSTSSLSTTRSRRSGAAARRSSRDG